MNKIYSLDGVTPNPRLVVDYKSCKVSLYPHCVGAFSYYSKKCLDKIGLLDERFFNAKEHLDHTYEIIKADSKFINTSDVNELKLVETEFLIGKLNITDAELIKELLYEAIMIIDPLKNKKYRIVFYAILKILLKSKLSTKTSTDTAKKLSWWDRIKRLFF
jgi:hypothetical protein